MKPTKDFDTRFSAAKKWRDAVEPNIKECLKFCCPGRENDFDRTFNSTEEYDTQVFVSLGEEVATDLAGDLVTYYTPAEAKWCEYLVTVPIPEDEADAVMKLVQDREDTLFEMIQASNYNDIAPQWGFEAASHGTPALWVSASHLS